MANQAQERRYMAYARPWLEQSEVQRMGAYIQHGNTTTLDHTQRVARASLALAEALHLKVDKADLVAGALLHDFYLYDWHDRTTSKPNHATKHSLYAAANARELLDVNARVASIIETHMWPLPPARVPASKEAWVVCAADKWCSLVETIGDRFGRNNGAGGTAAVKDVQAVKVASATRASAAAAQPTKAGGSHE